MTALQQSILAGFRTHGPCATWEALGNAGCGGLLSSDVVGAVYDLWRLGFIERVPSEKFAPQYRVVPGGARV